MKPLIKVLHSKRFRAELIPFSRDCCVPMNFNLAIVAGDLKQCFKKQPRFPFVLKGQPVIPVFLKLWAGTHEVHHEPGGRIAPRAAIPGNRGRWGTEGR